MEGKGHFGPFAVVLDQALFCDAQTPDLNGYVLPQDRIIPFLGGGPCSVRPRFLARHGVVVALGGAPVELVVATDISLQFLQVTAGAGIPFPMYARRSRSGSRSRSNCYGSIWWP